MRTFRIEAASLRAEGPVPDLTLRELVAPIVRDLLAESRDVPLMVSQRNSEAVLGIPSRTHLENCRRADFLPRVIRLGKLRLVDAEEYRSWLRAQAGVLREPTVDADGASQVLREIGLFSCAKATVDRAPTAMTADRRRPTVR